MTRNRRVLAAFAAIALLASPGAPVAASSPEAPRGAPPGPPGAAGRGVSLTATALSQFDTGLDGGGRFRWTGVILSGKGSRSLSPAWSAGLSARYDHEAWEFDGPLPAFPGGAPWSRIHRPSVGFNVGWSPARGLVLSLAPTVEWAFESGAATGDALSAGAVATAIKGFGPGRVLGLGAGVFRQLGVTHVFPFLVVNWPVTERLRVGNPLPAGPAGGAGLELAYALDDRWEAACGGTYRSYRFRLRGDGPYPGGIGESRSLPLFARLGRTLGPSSRFDLYGGAALDGKLSVTDREGVERAGAGYGAAPVAGITLSHLF